MSDCLNSRDFAWKDVAVCSFSLISGVGSVRRGFVYLWAVNLFAAGVFEEVVPQVSFGILDCPLVQFPHCCKLVPVGCGTVCLPLSES
jgi:hypothetical protein